MRLIGNKTRLLVDIEDFLRSRGVTGGVFLDIFSGTASVGRHFKALGFRVVANDHLPSCFTQAVAALEVSSYPKFEGLREKRADVFTSREFRNTLRRQLSFGFVGGGRSRIVSRPQRTVEAVHFLNAFVESREGIIYRNYCPGGPRGARYFTDETGKRIDGILNFLRESHADGSLPREELHLLLAALLDAADRVANISGTYGAYLKTWQRNALQPLRLEVPAVVESSLRHEAHREAANELVRRVSADVLYIDPPYNDRQYAANYHVLDVIADHHRVPDLDAFEAALYGKTGLRPWDDLRSAFCVPARSHSKGDNVLSAMADLILASRARHVLVSYNEEGLLTRDQIGGILALFSGQKTFAVRRDMRAISYKRFRSDSDRGPQDERGPRQYRVIDGRRRDEIHEWLFFARRAGVQAPRPGRLRRRTEVTS